MTGPAETYLAAIVDHQWDTLRRLVREDVVRIGPQGDDTFTDRESYVSYLSRLMPALPGYAMEIGAVTYADGGRKAFVELSETVTVQGAPLVTNEVLVVGFDESGLVARISIFTQKT